MTVGHSSLSRRSFLGVGATAALATSHLLPRDGSRARLLATLQSLADRRTVAAAWATGDPSLKALAAVALDAATTAGATFAEVRFRIMDTESWDVFLGSMYPAPYGDCVIAASVRALVRGYWGFAANAILATSDDMARLGREATAQARSGAAGKPREVNLAHTPVATGTWTMPVPRDPFTVSWEEKVDVIDGMSAFIAAQPVGAGTMMRLTFRRDQRTLVTTEGTYTSQIVFTSAAGLTVSVAADWHTEQPGSMMANFLTPAGAGWEYIRNAPFEERARQLIEQAEQTRRAKPVDIGRYDVVFDASAIASLIASTLGTATSLAHAMGADANDSGTSFLRDPLTMLGNFVVGAPVIQLSANRSLPGGAATVRWDDEGVEPDDVALVTRGVLTDFQTTRESASWLAPYYQRVGRPVRSHGCATYDTGTSPPISGTPNFVLAPGTHNETFDSLVASTKRGYAVLGGWTSADHQGLNAATQGGLVYEIRDGQLGAVIASSNLVTRAPEFWRHVDAVGGPASVMPVGVEKWVQGDFTVPYTISAVPVKASQVAVGDVMRRA